MEATSSQGKTSNHMVDLPARHVTDYQKVAKLVALCEM